MQNYWKQFNAWLDQRPLLHGAVVAIESSVVGTVVDYITNGGTLDFSPAGLKKLGTMIVGSAVIGLRMWLKASPLKGKDAPAELPDAAAGKAAGQ